MKRAKSKLLSRAGTGIVCLLIIALYFFPIYILLNVSVRDMTDLSSRLVPTAEPVFESYYEILTNPLFWKALVNTALYTALEICFLIPIASIGGYGLARSSGRIVSIIRSTNILVMMIPGTALLVGTYSLMVKLKLTNSIFGIALLGTGTSMTGAMFFYTVFTTMIPVELDEAAAIDGAGVLRTYFQIILPQMKAVTITRVISVLTGCWNNYLMPMYLLTKGDKYTLLLFVRKLFTGNTHVPDVPLAFAGCVLMILPILVVYFLLQKHIIGGQIDSAVKG